MALQRKRNLAPTVLGILGSNNSPFHNSCLFHLRNIVKC